MMGRAKQVIDLFRRSPRTAVSRIKGAISRRIDQRLTLVLDRNKISFLTNVEKLTPLTLTDLPVQVVSRPSGLDHVFDLLGSGPTKITRMVNSLERLINPANLAESQRIYDLIKEGPFAHPEYAPIDWQLDFKSGYRWAEKDHFLTVPYGHLDGVDIKVPWELSRLQHLVPAVLYGQGQNDDLIFKEVRAQILDFIALNPPRFGVNWRCPMDVGIRCVNLVMVYSLLRAIGIPLDDAFEDVIANSIQNHVDHILGHLEWSEEARGNHYFANVQGLLFGASVLPKTKRNVAILAFAVQEFFGETRRQFLPDGASFEGSTGYHRLSSEMLYWGCALIMGFDRITVEALDTYDASAIRPRPLFLPVQSKGFICNDGQIEIPDDIRDQVLKSSAFIQATTLADGSSLKIGDYDSGRLLKVCPSERNGREDILNHSGALSLASALFGPVEQGDGVILQALSRYRYLEKKGKSEVVFEPQGVICPHKTTDQQVKTFQIDDIGSIETINFPNYGLFIWRGHDFLLSVRCFSNAGLREWGHFHDDNLSVTLWSGGETLIADPGTFLYTPAPLERKIYQSASAHFVPRLEGCPAMKFGPSLFEARPLASGSCMAFDENGGTFFLTGEDWTLLRQIKISSMEIEITDMSLTAGRKLARDLYNPDVKDTMGYGTKTARSVYSV